MSSIDSQINTLIQEECKGKSLHEGLVSCIPELVSKWKNKLGDEKDSVIINKVLGAYTDKLKEGCAVNDVMQNMITLFNFTPEDVLKYNNIWDDVNTNIQSSYTSNPQYDSVVTKLLGVYKPAQGINACSIYKDRIQKQTNNYIRRVNGENVQIDQLIREMKALYNINEELESELKSFFESYTTPKTPDPTSTPEPKMEMVEDGVQDEETTEVPDVVTFDSLEESVKSVIKKMSEACESCQYDDIKETVYNAIRVCEEASKYNDPSFIENAVGVINEEGIYDSTLMETLKSLLEKYYNKSYTENEEAKYDLTVDQGMMLEVFCRDEPKEEIDIEIVDDIIKPEQKFSRRMLRFFNNDD
jgi:hypothetical protein